MRIPLVSINLDHADPATLRAVASQLQKQAKQLFLTADRIEEQARRSAARPLRTRRAARLANAYIFSGMGERQAVFLASAKANVEESATRAALIRLRADQQKREKARIIMRALSLRQAGKSIRQIAAEIAIPKSTLADWLGSRTDNQDHESHHHKSG
jgi:hypothetical protein